MGRVITLSGLPARLGATAPPEPEQIGGGCAPMGATEIAYGGTTHCVFPEYRNEKGCAAEGLVRAVEFGNLEKAKANDHMYLCAERAAIGATTPDGPLVEVDAQGDPVSGVPGADEVQLEKWSKYLMKASAIVVVGAVGGYAGATLWKKPKKVRIKSAIGGAVGAAAAIGLLYAFGRWRPDLTN
jgi:hypothetical protein